MNYSGSNYEDFLELLHVNYEGVQEYEAFTTDLSVLSFLHQAKEDENALVFAKMNGTDILDEYSIHGVKVNIENMKYENPEALEEIYHEQYLLYDNSNKVSLWPTTDLMKTFSQILKIKGSFFFKPGFARNAVLAQEFETPMHIRFITKRKDNRIFLYGVAGNYFVMEDEFLIPDLITLCEDKYGKMKCCGWKMNDQLIKIFCQFSNLTTIDGYELGLYIQTSNVMMSSFRCQFVMKKGNMIIPLDGVVKKHTKKLVAEDIAQELFKKEKCLRIAKYKLNQGCAKSVLDSAKDSKIYNMLGKKRLKAIFPYWRESTDMTRNEVIEDAQEHLDIDHLGIDLYLKACQLLGYILMDE